VIDTTTHTVIATIPVGLFPGDVAISPDGTRAYTPSIFNQTVSVIDTATNTVIDNVLGVAASAIAVTPDGARAYAVSSSGVFVIVIDPATNTW
jgi:YVTN family beta-propeller protein